MLKALFHTRTDNVSIQFFRYLFVGGGAFVVDFGSLLILTEWFNIYYLFSAALAFLLGLITNYFLSTTWVFNKRTLNKRHHEFIIFAIIGIVGLGLNELIIWYFTEKFLFHYAFSKIIAAAVVLFWNFTARKIVLFR